MFEFANSIDVVYYDGVYSANLAGEDKTKERRKKFRSKVRGIAFVVISILSLALKNFRFSAPPTRNKITATYTMVAVTPRPFPPPLEANHPPTQPHPPARDRVIVSGDAHPNLTLLPVLSRHEDRVTKTG